MTSSANECQIILSSYNLTNSCNILIARNIGPVIFLIPCIVCPNLLYKSTFDLEIHIFKGYIRLFICVCLLRNIKEVKYRILCLSSLERSTLAIISFLVLKIKGNNVSISLPLSKAEELHIIRGAECILPNSQLAMGLIT